MAFGKAKIRRAQHSSKANMPAMLAHLLLYYESHSREQPGWQGQEKARGDAFEGKASRAAFFADRAFCATGAGADEDTM
jgi:hypothetical protein